MKKSVKIISALLLAVMLTVSISPICFASQIGPGDISPNYQGIDTSGIKNTASKIMGFIRNVAVIAGVLIIAILGLKYMLGSTEERADYKKSFMPLIIGIVVVMGATQIATMIFSTFGN